MQFQKNLTGGGFSLQRMLSSIPGKTQEVAILPLYFVIVLQARILNISNPTVQVRHPSSSASNCSSVASDCVRPLPLTPLPSFVLLVFFYSFQCMNLRRCLCMDAVHSLLCSLRRAAIAALGSTDRARRNSLHPGDILLMGCCRCKGFFCRHCRGQQLRAHRVLLNRIVHLAHEMHS